MAPCRVFRISGTQTRMPRQTLVRFVVMTRFHVASSISSTTPADRPGSIVDEDVDAAEALRGRLSPSLSMSAMLATSVRTNIALPPRRGDRLGDGASLALCDRCRR